MAGKIIWWLVTVLLFLFSVTFIVLRSMCIIDWSWWYVIILPLWLGWSSFLAFWGGWKSDEALIALYCFIGIFLRENLFD